MSAPVTREAIVALLQHYPEGLTIQDIADELGMHMEAVNTSVRYERRKRGSELFRRLRYQPVRGRGGRQQPVYGIGPGPDASPPKPNTRRAQNQAKARYRAANRALLNAQFRVRRGTNTASPWAGLL